jgi:class 3 adenylate cyclase
MRCPACGQDNADQKRFCGSCGIPLSVNSGSFEKPAAELSEPSQPSAIPTHQAPEASPPPQTPTPEASESSPPPSFGGGRYQVVRILGEGGSKIVYLARDNLLDREVALSLIKIGGFDEQEKARITREAQAMAKLGDHPNIVTIHDVGEDAGRPYIVTQYMAGGSIDDLLRRSPHHHLPIDDAIRIGDEICKALEYAHEHGVIHRDLKPGNAWLTKEGISKLGDFGLALAAGQPRLTATGLVAGTVAYMAPEQVMGKPVDARSDLYSLGAMLYEMVTGRPPFLGDNIATVIAQQLNSEPLRPSQLLPDVAPSIDRLILKLLAKTPGDRFSSAADVRQALAALNQANEPRAAGVPKREDIATTVARELPHLNLPEGTLSMFFSDIEGSTAMWERLGDLKAVDVLRDHDAIIREQVDAHQGFIVNTTGDGFYVIFKTVRQAILCAIEIQRELATYSRTHRDQPIRIRIGLHVGEAKRESNEYHGNAVNFAARVMAQANGGEIATSASFMDLAKDAGDIRFDHGREVTMKGFPGTYRIYRVAWNVTKQGEWLCPNCTRIIPAEQRACVACAVDAQPTAVHTPIAVTTTSPAAAASTPIPLAAATRSPLTRVMAGSALFLLLAVAGFAGVYFYNNQSAHPPVGNLATIGSGQHLQSGQNSASNVVQSGQNSAPPDQGSNVEEIASLGFTSMSLDPCGKTIPVAVYTKDVLSTAGCLKWSASFKNYPNGLQNPGNVLEVTVFDPNNQEVSQGGSDSLSGDPQSGGSFAGTVAIPDMTGYPDGEYMAALSAGNTEIASRPFYVLQDVDYDNIDQWMSEWNSDNPGAILPTELVVVEPYRRAFWLHRYHRWPFWDRHDHRGMPFGRKGPYDKGPDDRNLSEGTAHRPIEREGARPAMREASNPFKAPPSKTYQNPFEPGASSADGRSAANPFQRGSSTADARGDSNPFTARRDAIGASNPFSRRNPSPFSPTLPKMPGTRPVLLSPTLTRAGGGVSLHKK